MLRKFHAGHSRGHPQKMVVERRAARPPASTAGVKPASKGDGLAGQASNRSSTSTTPTGSGRGGIVRPLQRVPSISGRPTGSRGKEHGHAPITDPALKLRRPGKEEISYIQVLNKVKRRVQASFAVSTCGRMHVCIGMHVCLSVHMHTQGSRSCVVF
jgi:hypothetical protein